MKITKRELVSLLKESMDGRVPRDVVEDIARTYLGIRSLETRHSDSLDFHEVAVWSIVDALEAAYKDGYEAGRESASPKVITVSNTR